MSLRRLSNRRSSARVPPPHVRTTSCLSFPTLRQRAVLLLSHGGDLLEVHPRSFCQPMSRKTVLLHSLMREIQNPFFFYGHEPCLHPRNFDSDGESAIDFVEADGLPVIVFLRGTQTYNAFGWVTSPQHKELPCSLGPKEMV